MFGKKFFQPAYTINNISKKSVANNDFLCYTNIGKCKTQPMVSINSIGLTNVRYGLQYL